MLLKIVLFVSMQDNKLLCLYINTDHQCLRHGGCHIQEACEGPRLLGHWIERGPSVCRSLWVSSMTNINGYTWPVTLSLSVI